MPKLTKTLVDSTRPSAGRVYVWDSDIQGFGLQVLPSGVKSFVYQYRTPEGRTRRGTLGKLSEAFTTEQARERAKAWRRKLEGGTDPLGEKAALREAPTVADMLDAYTDSPKFRELSQLSQSYDKGRIEHHLKPLLGRKHVHKLTRDDVRGAFKAITDGKTAVDKPSGKLRGRIVVKGGEGAARMAIRVLRAAINWAIGEGMATTNAAAGVDIGTDDRRYVSLKVGDYQRLFETLDTLEKKRQIRRPVADAIRLASLTGMRRNEVAALRHEHVDLKAGVITLPRTAHKTGKRTGEAKRIGLPSAAQAILARQPEGEPDSYVFPPSKGEGPLSLSPAWRKVREAAKLPKDMGLHGLRHALASHMALDGAEAAQIMATLGHRQLSTAQRYIDFARDERAAMAESATKKITAAMNGKPKRKQRAKVLKLSNKRART